ncbi:MAG: ABC transporter permease [Elusimicrobiota bacterium]|jgi:macrolide transport system ATP-binding/permease protein|nr:ABC transporter permease [Elusimicrobiota bacterium]
MKIIELKNLKKTYHLEKTEVPVLHGINLEIEQGEFVMIMGASGSGKSTLLNILGLLDKPSSGSFKLVGTEIAKFTDDQTASLRNHYLGFIFQQFNLLPKLTAVENVALPSIYSNIKNKRYLEDSKELLDTVGLSQRIHHRPNELSGGQQQRVAIARSLINKPIIIFADEPTGNLDSKSSQEIIKLLKDLNNSGITIVMVTHELELKSYATRTITLRDGAVVSDEKAKDIEQRGEIKSDFHWFKKSSFSFLRFKDYFLEAWRSLVGNRMRSILSILGVMIGVASLIAMLAVGKGAQISVEERVANLGSNLLMITPGNPQRAGISSESGARLRFTNDDVYDLKENVKGIKYASGNVAGRVQIVANGKNYNTRLEGVSADYEFMRNSTPQIGHFFTKQEDDQKKRVVLLGRTVVEKIYGDADYNPVGDYIRVGWVDFQIIGVLPKKGYSGWRDEDDKVTVPLLTALYRLAGNQYFSSIDVEVENGYDMNIVSDAIVKRLLFIHRFLPAQTDAVRIRNMAEIQETMAQMSRAFSLLLGSIAFISLLVGGIGIMNIMFVSVTERTKEIGLRKAIGANNSDILFQFIIESVFICCSGGIIGIVFGFLASLIIGKYAGWATSISSFSVILAFCFSVLIGLIFGVWPAMKASRLNPIDALRRD